ncbi:cell division protein ftsL [Vibrio ishigakensis]|uniref:Cell division protein FtsL n=1 Tax=Vibrio ishigakensis TaxID=1481914 RepID=A0A0B8NSQ4_9VIBR|nr:cell division protein ftsL [Vibrio ishigakensis]
MTKKTRKLIKPKQAVTAKRKPRAEASKKVRVNRPFARKRTKPSIKELITQPFGERIETPDHEQIPLLGVHIVRDLFTAGRIPMFLLIIIFFSAMSVVLTTHLTRQAIDHKNQALTAREKLDDEWRNLIIEENSLSEHSRVQKVAVSELEMTRPDSDKEVLVKLK